MSNAPSQTGQAAEQAACTYLESQGLNLLEKNYRCCLGEIDLIMTDISTLVFVEVRYRRQLSYGSGAESVTYGKQQKIIKTAQHFLASHQSHTDKACRFDVISVTHTPRNYAFNWIKDAFQLNHGY